MYVKLFQSIYQGTLRGNSHGLLVFTNLLAHADKDGFVDIHPRAISEEVGLPIEKVKQALLLLESVDEESRSPDEQGRRIIRIDEHRAWGWHIVNYVKYREIRNHDDRKEQNRLAQARFREKNKADSKHSKPPSAHADADADAEEKAQKAKPAAFVLPDWIPAETWKAYCKVRAGKKAKNEPHALGLIVKDLQVFKEAGHDPVFVLNNSIKSGWAGVFEPKGVAPKNTENVWFGAIN